MSSSGRLNIAGQRFGRLVAILCSGIDRHRQAVWLCRCDCGNEKEVLGGNLRRGLVVSCGCWRRESTTKRRTRHGHDKGGTPSSEMSALRKAISRCHLPSDGRYKDYGARGVKVCDRWRFGEAGLSGIECLLQDLGPKPKPKRNYSMERMDNEGDYRPGNVRWATAVEQANNRRSNRLVPLNGKMVPMQVWCKATGISRGIAMRAMARGITLDELVARRGHVQSIEKT